MTEKDALERVVAAWDALPAGHHSGRDVDRWMRDHMWHAVNDAREALGRPRSDNLAEAALS